MHQKIPSYLTEKKNIVQLILFTAAFALVFINIYSPFGVNYWYKVSGWELLAYSSIVILTGVLVVVISRVLMYVVCRRSLITIGQYLIWVLAEVFFMAVFYTLFEKLILKDDRFILDLLKVSIQNTALVLLLPYSTSWLFFSWRDKKLLLDKIANGQSVSDNSKNMIVFHDEKKVLRLSVKYENLLYIEASDNYVNIFYLNKDKVSKFLLRNSLKRMEEQFKNTDIIRCHRSYMVNFEKIKVVKKDKEGLKLEFDLPQTIDLPVSKSYVENVMSTFSR